MEKWRSYGRAKQEVDCFYNPENPKDVISADMLSQAMYMIIWPFLAFFLFLLILCCYIVDMYGMVWSAALYCKELCVVWNCDTIEDAEDEDTRMLRMWVEETEDEVEDENER